MPTPSVVGSSAACRPSSPADYSPLPSVWAFVAVATTTPAADFCVAVRVNRFPLSPDSGTRRRSPEVSSTAFDAHPPDLPPAALMDVGFAVSCPLARCRRPRHPVFVHRLAPLLHASFRPRLATTPLRFAITSPPSGCEEDFHLQAVDHARHTKNGREKTPGRLVAPQTKKTQLPLPPSSRKTRSPDLPACRCRGDR